MAITIATSSGRICRMAESLVETRASTERKAVTTRNQVITLTSGPRFSDVSHRGASVVVRLEMLLMMWDSIVSQTLNNDERQRQMKRCGSTAKQKARPLSEYQRDSYSNINITSQDSLMVDDGQGTLMKDTQSPAFFTLQTAVRISRIHLETLYVIVSCDSRGESRNYHPS